MFFVHCSLIYVFIAQYHIPNMQATLDFTITSPLNHSTLNEESVMAGSAANSANMMRNATAWATFVSP